MSFSRFDFTEKYWNGLPQKSRDLYEQVRPMVRPRSACNYRVGEIEGTLADFHKDCAKRGGKFDLNPEFQRGHVWDEAKQVAYIESFLRNVAPATFKFNCANYNDFHQKGDLNPEDMVCIDGLQRITALRRFMAGDIKAFGHDRTYFDNTPFSLHRMNYTFIMEIFVFTHKKNLLQFYIDLNSGGVVHTQEEIERVRKLMEE